MRRAEDYTARTPAKTIAAEIVQYFPGLKAEDIEPAIERYKQYGIWKREPRIEPAALNTLQDLLIEDGLLDAGKRVSPGLILTNDFAEKTK